MFLVSWRVKGIGWVLCRSPQPTAYSLQPTARQPPIANHCPCLLHRQHKKTASPWVSLVLFPLFLSSIFHRRPVFYQSSLIISNHPHSPLLPSIVIRYHHHHHQIKKASQLTCKSRWLRDYNSNQLQKPSGFILTFFFSFPSRSWSPDPCSYTLIDSH